MKLSCEAIKKRHSCRLFDSSKTISDGEIQQLIYAASLAPSGKKPNLGDFRQSTKSR